jgi:hypothetical protein
MSVPHRKYTYGPLRPVTEIALFLYMCMMFVPHGKHTYGLSGPVTGIANDVRTSQEVYLWASTARYRNSFTSLYVYDVCTSQETHLQVSTAC